MVGEVWIDVSWLDLEDFEHVMDRILVSGQPSLVWALFHDNVLKDVSERQGVLRKVFSEIQVSDEEIQNTVRKYEKEMEGRKF